MQSELMLPQRLSSLTAFSLRHTSLKERPPFPDFLCHFSHSPPASVCFSSPTHHRHLCVCMHAVREKISQRVARIMMMIADLLAFEQRETRLPLLLSLLAFSFISPPTYALFFLLSVSTSLPPDEPSFSISREPGFGYPIVAGMTVTLKCEIGMYIKSGISCQTLILLSSPCLS